ncbi:DUF5776 domain-containing protein [Levilactobacillus tujiorum]|uniref:DUF5776 domain-containing protein n=1 Tax=Levilactobacillus tujiorum TaxID=2912243 RepID=UPI0014564629|nr:DUF5776 domain-containing protein [Levilactobacillus tujiorum]NLR32896.1 MucBP domain-containing protein [Levilactobacillus tujiorum]
MLNTTRKIIMTSLTLILFGGILPPSIANADTTSSATTATGDKQTAVTVSGMGLPYSTIEYADGHVDTFYKYPKIDNTISINELKDNTYTDNLRSQYPNDSYIDDIIENGADYIDSLSTTLNLNQSRAAYILSQAGLTSMTPEEYANAIGIGAALTAWTLSVGTKVANNEMSQAEAKTSYETVLAPLLKQVPGYANIANSYQSMVDSDESQFKTALSISVNGVASRAYLSNHLTTELSALDPAASRAKTTALFLKPMSNFYHKQADGTYLLDGSMLDETPIALSEAHPVKTPDPIPAASQPVTVHYVDDQGNTLKADKVLTGKLGDSYQTTPLDINGYAVTKTTGEESGTFGSTAKSVTYTYSAVLSNGGAAATIAPKGTVVYATKKIGLYKNATFTKKARKQWYAKQKRINRPMFVVTGYAKSQNGVKRYRVKDVNHRSKTDGLTGYITANAKYTQRVYYAAKHQKVTVINPQGVNDYGKKNLTNKKTHYKRGQVLKVKKIVNHNLTTRFVLSNGTYVTANKRLVKALN